jgi:hypothetical protein
MEHMGPYLQSFLPFAQKRLGFNRPPTIFFDSDAENAQQVLGKTGYYDPDASEIVIFVDNRHPKDVLRSLSHELVHHAQNCRGDLNPEVAGETELGYAQNNTHMRGMESEAYEKGNLCMRDWEDSVKLQLQETNYLHTKGDSHKMATYEELKERITKSVVQKMMERKKRDTPRDNRGIPQRLKVSEAEAQRKPGSNPWQDQLDKEDAEETEEAEEAQRAKTAGGAARQRARGRGQQRGKEAGGFGRYTEGDLDQDAIVNEEEEEIEERKKRDNPRNGRGIPQRLKVNEEADEEAGEEDEEEVSEAKEGETLDEWYQKELYQKLTNRWTQ